MAEFFTAETHVKDSALRLHVLAGRIKQATQFAQQESVLKAIAKDIAEALSLAEALAERYPTEAKPSPKQAVRRLRRVA